MGEVAVYGAVGILFVLCIIQEWIRVRAVRKAPNAQELNRDFLKVCALLYALALPCAGILQLPTPGLFLVLIVTGIMPYIGTTYTDWCMQAVKMIIFMSVILISKGIVRMGGLDLGGTEVSATAYVVNLCAAELIVVIFSGLFERTYQFHILQELYDRQRLRIFSRFVLFCVMYIFLDGILSLLDYDALFIPVTALVGNLLILVLLTAFFHYNNRLAEQARLEQEYQKLEAEKAMQSWREQKLLDMTRKDALTGAYSRRYTLGIMEELDRQKCPYTVAYIDMDGMKQINDEQGHDAGDRYLKGFVRAMGEKLPKEATLARMGGDEFLIVFPEMEEAAVEAWIKGFSENLEQYSFSFGLAGGQGTKSSGEGQDGEQKEPVIRRADQMMYEAKRNKKGGADI